MNDKPKTGISKVRPVILSGGSGTRLWPLSRADRPKQLLRLIGDKTLLQLTALRTRDSGRFANPIIVANERHALAISSQFGEIGISADRIILEPVARNTAAAITLAALCSEPDDVLVVMPSDHMISDVSAFVGAVDTAASLARENWLVAVGLTPSRAETGFGYIRRGTKLSDDSFEAAGFVEKPDHKTAERYLASHEFLWNAGIFIFTAERFLEEVGRHAQEVALNVARSIEHASGQAGFLRPDKEAFSASPSISVDYAVMEKAERLAVVPVQMGWSDLGSWDALDEFLPGDEAGNRLEGNVIVAKSARCSIRSAGPLVAAVGVEDLTIVATPDAVLVMPKGQSHEIKHITDQLKALRSATLQNWPNAANGDGRGSAPPD